MLFGASLCHSVCHHLKLDTFLIRRARVQKETLTFSSPRCFVSLFQPQKISFPSPLSFCLDFFPLTTEKSLLYQKKNQRRCRDVCTKKFVREKRVWVHQKRGNLKERKQHNKIHYIYTLTRSKVRRKKIKKNKKGAKIESSISGKKRQKEKSNRSQKQWLL